MRFFLVVALFAVGVFCSIALIVTAAYDRGPSAGIGELLLLLAGVSIGWTIFPWYHLFVRRPRTRARGKR